MTYTEQTTKKAQVAYIREHLLTSFKWASKGLITIYGFQTASEQNMGHTHDDNGVGFSGVDSEILSSFAEQVNKGRNLSTKQIVILHRLMPKYAGQLHKISNKEQ